MSPQSTLLVGIALGFIFGFGLGRVWEIYARMEKVQAEMDALEAEMDAKLDALRSKA